MRRLLFQVSLFCLALSWIPSFAQSGPAVVSIESLSQNPRTFDGRLVSVRASLVFGWEGDNFLYDTTGVGPDKTLPHHKPSVWFYCKPGYEKIVYSAVPYNVRPVRGTFVGYFHFVPKQKGRIKDVFDPGPLQLEVIGVTSVDPPPTKPT